MLISLSCIDPYFHKTLKKEKLLLQPKSQRKQSERGGIDSGYRSYRNKLAACDIARGRCRPACNSTGGRGGRGNSLHPSHPHPTHFFCPVPANRPKEMNKLHPSRIFSPSVNYHKQMLDRLAIWFGSSFWVPPGSVLVVPAWLLAVGTQPTMGIAATIHNGGFN